MYDLLYCSCIPLLKVFLNKALQQKSAFYYGPACKKLFFLFNAIHSLISAIQNLKDVEIKSENSPVNFYFYS